MFAFPVALPNSRADHQEVHQTSHEHRHALRGIGHQEKPEGIGGTPPAFRPRAVLGAGVILEKEGGGASMGEVYCYPVAGTIEHKGPEPGPDGCVVATLNRDIRQGLLAEVVG